MGRSTKKENKSDRNNRYIYSKVLASGHEGIYFLKSMHKEKVLHQDPPGQKGVLATYFPL